MNHKQLLQQMTAMQAQIDTYRTELDNLRNQVAAYEDVETPIEAPKAGPTSRRKLLKRMAIAGIGGIGAIGLAAATNPNYSVLAQTVSADTAIEARAGQNGYGVQAYGGLAPLFLSPVGPNVGPGAPTPAGHLPGELYVDSVGTLFFASGTSGTAQFRRLTGTSVPGAFSFLGAPQRVINTNSQAGPVVGGQSGAFSAPRNWVLQGQLGIPANATAVMGTITAMSPTAFASAYTQAGAVGVYATGSATGAAVISYNAGNLLISSFFVSALNGAGSLTIDPQGKSTQVLVDIVGYYA